MFCNEFDNIFANVDLDTKVGIFTHRAPDPDAVGAAVGIQWLLQTVYKLESKIFYEGRISHPQNQTMLNVLDLSIYSFDEYKAGVYRLGIIVDATTQNVNAPVHDVTIDHHRSEEEDGISLIESVGAASTLVWELIKEICNKKDASLEDMPVSVATALSLGIRTDTSDLIKETSTERDFQAAQDLNPFLDRKKLSGIVSYPWPRYFLELEKLMNEDGNGKFVDSVYVGTIGVISPAKRDALPVFADKMLRIEGVETSVIFGVVGDRLEASIRSQNASLDVNAFCKKVFGKEYAGGKFGEGGAGVPLGLFSLSDSPDEIKDKMWDALKDKVFHLLFETLAGNS